MKYLVLGKPKALPIPPEMAINLYQAAITWVDSMTKAGKVDSVYIFPEGGGMAIGNVNTHEEAFDMLTSYPLYGFFDWQVESLVDWKHAYNTIIEMYKKMGAK